MFIKSLFKPWMQKRNLFDFTHHYWDAVEILMGDDDDQVYTHLGLLDVISCGLFPLLEPFDPTFVIVGIKAILALILAIPLIIVGILCAWIHQRDEVLTREESFGITNSEIIEPSTILEANPTPSSSSYPTWDETGFDFHS